MRTGVLCQFANESITWISFCELYWGSCQIYAFDGRHMHGQTVQAHFHVTSAHFVSVPRWAITN